MSHVTIYSPDEVARHKAEALAAVDRMVFPPGTAWEFDANGATTQQYIRVTGDLLTCPLIAWGRHEWGQGVRSPVAHVGWLGATELLGVSRHAGVWIMSAADDWQTADPTIRAALLKKCGLEEARA